AASILSADFGRLGEEVRAVQDAGVDWIHVDVMDGHFVPNLTIGPMILEAVRKSTTLPLDVHLMIEKPERYIGDFAQAGATYISVHQEACPHIHAVVQQIRKLEVKPSVAINPGTPLSAVEAILPDIEMLLVMSVNPGFGGQQFIESSTTKLAAAKRMRAEHGLDFFIEVDGGGTVHNPARSTAAGAEVLVIGSGIFETDNYRETVRELRQAAA